MISPMATTNAADRVLKLSVIDGMKPLTATGDVDPSLFKEDGNKLHAVMDSESCLWTFKYEKGAVPPALKGSFTGFRALKKHADNYYLKRNVQVTELKD